MFQSLTQFLDLWREESEHTAKVLTQLTDHSLSQPVAPGYRTLGQVAWHVAGSIGDMAALAGLRVEAPNDKLPPPKTAAEIVAHYRHAAHGLSQAIVAHWTDDSLRRDDDVYGRRWPRAYTLWILLAHQVHHRGQMTVLMRQAGLPVPAVYGPSKRV